MIWKQVSARQTPLEKNLPLCIIKGATGVDGLQFSGEQSYSNNGMELSYSSTLCLSSDPQPIYQLAF